jgi:hypothetical protein
MFFSTQKELNLQFVHFIVFLCPLIYKYMLTVPLPFKPFSPIAHKKNKAKTNALACILAGADKKDISGSFRMDSNPCI